MTPRAPATRRRTPAGRATLPATSQQTKAAVALVDGPYDRMWFWRDDFDTYRDTGTWRHMRDYVVTTKQVVNHVKDLEHLVADVAEYAPQDTPEPLP